MMHDDSMDEVMGKALREVDPPPPTPREEIWAGIQARRGAARAPGYAETGHGETGQAGTGQAEGNGQTHRGGPGDHTTRPAGVIELASRRRRTTTWLPLSAAIAATLVLGIALGRMSRDTDPGATGAATPGSTAAGDPAPDAGTPGDAVPTAYRLAAANHLERTETLLASLSVDSQPGGVREMSSWARELLTDTRLLLSSPAAQDAATRRLLEDLELILAQIAGIPEARAEQEVELIHEGINQSDVLLRLRAATAGPRLVGT